MQELHAAVVEVLLSERVHRLQRLAAHEAIDGAQLQLPEGGLLDDREADLLLLLLVVRGGQQVLGGQDLRAVRQHLQAQHVDEAEVERPRLYAEGELRRLEGAVKQAEGEAADSAFALA